MVLGRAIKPGANLRCDFCRKQIPANKVAYQVGEGDAQGVYHGPRCYQAALKHYRELQKQV